MNKGKITDITASALKGHHDGYGLTELCFVEVMDDPDPVSGAYHEYDMTRVLTDAESEGRGAVAIPCGNVRFQRGPRNDLRSTPGILDGALLSVLIHRMECLQSGAFPCPGNEEKLSLLLRVRQLDKDRANERAARGVLGKNVK